MYKFENGSVLCFFGDSIIANGHMIRRIYEHYRKSGINIEIYNCGIPGDTALGGFERIYDTVFCYNPTDVVLSFGMNDMKYFLYDGREATDSCILERRNALDTNLIYMKKIADECSKRGIRLTFNTITPYDEFTEGGRPCFEGTSAALFELSERIKVLAKDYGNNVVNEYKEFKRVSKKLFKEGKTLTGEDRIHPLKEGQELMSQIFLNAQGFDVEIVEDYDTLVNLSNRPFDEWEEKRFKLEKEAKINEFVEWVVCHGVKDIKIIDKILEEKIRSEEEWLANMFREYLEKRDKALTFKQELEKYTKTIYDIQGDIVI